MATIFNLRFSVSGSLDANTEWRPPARLPASVNGYIPINVVNLGRLRFDNPEPGSPLASGAGLMIGFVWMGFTGTPAATMDLNHPSIDNFRRIVESAGASQTQAIFSSLNLPRGSEINVFADSPGPHVVYLTMIQIGSSRDVVMASLLPKTPDLNIFPQVRASDMSANSVGTAAIENNSVTTAKRVYSTRTNAADAQLVIGANDDHINISSAGGAAPAATDTTAMKSGKPYTIVMTAFNTNPYTIAVGGGALTFNAANEGATIVSDGTTVRVAGLAGATIV